MFFYVTWMFNLDFFEKVLDVYVTRIFNVFLCNLDV